LHFAVCFIPHDPLIGYLPNLSRNALVRQLGKPRDVLSEDSLGELMRLWRICRVRREGELTFASY
jgi:hypothetical protein